MNDLFASDPTLVFLSFLAGPLRLKTAVVHELTILIGRRVRLSALVLSLLAPKAFGASILVG